MFGILTLLICSAFLTFGATLPFSWLALTILWLACTAGLLVVSSIRKRRLNVRLAVVFAVSAVLFAVLPPKPALGFMAGIWAWAAAYDNSKGTLRFFRFLLLLGVGEAVLGLFQFFVNPGWIFGYMNPYAQDNRASGTLINKNHFAGLLEMLIPVAIGFAYIAIRRHRDVARLYVYLLEAGFMGLALVFSISRMGIFSFLLTILLFAVLLRLRESTHRLSTAMGLGVVALVTAGALWVGLDIVVQRYSELVGVDVIVREGRFITYRDSVRLISDHPLGVGSGHYQDAFRRYQTFRLDRLFDHAHNDYLETAAEWGVPLSLFFWAFVISVLISSVSAFLHEDSPERRGILLACIGSIFAILIHSLTDFNLQIPSNAMLFFSFVGIAVAFAKRSGGEAGESG